MWGELAIALQSGNIYLWFIAAVSFIATVISFERVIALYFVYSIDFSGFINNLRKMLASKDLDRAMTFCRSVSKTSLPRIALAAVEAKDLDPTTVRGTIEEHTSEFLPRLETRIHFLPTLAILVLLTGLLGTVDALWLAFRSVDVLDSTQKQITLARGMAGALNPTAFGLMASMFILLGYQIAKNMALRLVDELQYGITVLHNLLVPAEQPILQVSHAEQVAKPHLNTPSESPSTTTAEPAQQTAEAPLKEALNDASIEDIKDEEEVI